MASIGQALGGLKGRRQDFAVEALSQVLRPAWVTEALTATGRESRRQRKLPAALTLWCTVLMGVFRQLSCANLLEKLHAAVGTLDLWGLTAPPCTSALTKARDRLGVAPLRYLFELATRRWCAGRGGRRFHGLGVVAIDGSTAKLPHPPANSRRFGRPGASRGRSAFPQLRLVALLDIGTRVVTHVAFGRYRKGELTLAASLLPAVSAGTLLLADRLYFAAHLLWPLHHEQGAEFVVRAKRTHQARRVRRLGPDDELVEVPIAWAARQRADLPRTWLLRRITVRRGRGKKRIVLLTSLLDPGIAPTEIAALYRERWDEELAFDEIKTHLCGYATVNRPVLFRSHTPDRVEQELYALLLAYNALRRVMVAAARVARHDSRRLSFVGALERTRDALTEMLRLPTSYLPERYERLMHAIGRGEVPLRPGRRYPRKVRVKMSNFQCKGSRRAS